MNNSHILKAAAHFGNGEPVITQLGEGLIHKTYKVDFTGENKTAPIALQCINTIAFKEPVNIIHNYRLITAYLENKKGTHITPLVPAIDGTWFWIDEEKKFWRATAYIPGSITLLFPQTAAEATTTASCFGAFTSALAGLEAGKLKIIIPGFHDLSFRYQQFEEAIKKATIQRLLKSTHVIAELRQRKKLVDFYAGLEDNPAYKIRVMHHDCKMSNILLDAGTHEVICPIDLDTVMPGYFFSDIGDMIRSMCCTVDENSTQWEDIAIKKEFYDAIVKGYLAGMGSVFTKEERDHIHYAGLLMIYMQSMRFVTDFLNNDSYYQTTYPEQNLNRALNQLILLEKLEEFLEQEYGD